MLKHLGAKIVALLVAVLLWVQVASSERVEQLVELPLVVVGLPDSLVVRRSTLPRAVGVRVEATKLQLLLASLFQRGLGRVEVDLSNTEPGTLRYELSSVDADVQGVPKEIVPARTLEITVHRLAKRSVPVRMVSEGQLPEGFTLAGRPEITPARVELSGPQRLVEFIDHVNTEPVRLTRRRSSFGEKVRLALPDRDVELRPVEVNVAVGVDEIVERVFESIPVTILSELDPERIQLSETTARVRLVGAAGVVRSLGPSDVSVLLHIDENLSGVAQLDAQVVVPDGVTSWSVEPSSFQVIVEHSGGEGGRRR